MVEEEEVVVDEVEEEVEEEEEARNGTRYEITVREADANARGSRSLCRRVDLV